MATLQPYSPQLASARGRALTLGVPFSNRNARDYSGLGRTPSFVGNVIWGTGPRGSVLRHTNNADRTTFGTLSDLSLTAATVVLGLRKTDATLRASSAFGVPLAGGTAAWGSLCPFSDGVVYWDWGGVAAGTTRLSVAGLSFGDDIWCFTTGPRGMEIWQNGVRRASNGATPARTSNTGAFGFGNYTGGSDLVDHSALLIFSGQLPTDAIRELSGDPWAPFRTPQGPSIVRVVAGLSYGSPPTFVPAWAARSNTLLT